MRSPFFICGTPRSRTAWFSVVTSGARSVCYHEPTAHLKSFDQLVSLWTADAGMSIGVSDSSLSLQIGRILRVIKPRTLMIRRPIDEIMASFHEYLNGADGAFDYGLGRRYLEECADEMDRRASHPLIKQVAFSDLENPSVLSECLNWLLPDDDLPDVKFLSRMNIQVRRTDAMTVAGRSHNGWHLVP